MAIEESDGLPGSSASIHRATLQVRPPSDCGPRQNAGANHVAQRMPISADEATPPVRDRATRVAIRRAAASKKWPEPQAGSSTVTERSAATGSSVSASILSSTDQEPSEQRLHQPIGV